MEDANLAERESTRLRAVRKKLTPVAVASERAKGSQRDIYDTEVRGLALRVFPSGARSWMVFYRFAGKSRKVSIGNAGTHGMGLAEARKLAFDYREQAAAGVDPAAEPIQDGKPKTVTQLAARYMRKHARRVKRSADQDLRMLQTYVKPKIGTLALAEVAKRDVLQVVEAIAETGALAQADAVLTLLRTMFRWAVAEELAERDPTEGVRKRRKPIAKDRALSRIELKTVWDAISALPVDTGVRDILKLLILTGQRAAEVIEVERAELDLEAIELDECGQEQPCPVWIIPSARTKNKREHKLPLSASAAAVFRSALDRSRSNRFVFPGLAGAPLTEGVARRALHRAIANDAFNYQAREGGKAVTRNVAKFGPHDLRRTMATRMDEDLEIDEAIISRLLNHTRSGVTAKHYNHAKKLRQMRHAAERWAAYIQALEMTTTVVVPLVTAQRGK